MWSHRRPCRLSQSASVACSCSSVGTSRVVTSSTSSARLPALPPVDQPACVPQPPQYPPDTPLLPPHVHPLSRLVPVWDAKVQGVTSSDRQPWQGRRHTFQMC